MAGCGEDEAIATLPLCLWLFPDRDSFESVMSRPPLPSATFPFAIGAFVDAELAKARTAGLWPRSRRFTTAKPVKPAQTAPCKVPPAASLAMTAGFAAAAFQRKATWFVGKAPQRCLRCHFTYRIAFPEVRLTHSILINGVKSRAEAEEAHMRNANQAHPPFHAAVLLAALNSERVGPKKSPRGFASRRRQE